VDHRVKPGDDKWRMRIVPLRRETLRPRLARVGTPDQKTPFDHADKDIDQDDEGRQHEHAGKDAGDVEHAFGLLDQVAQPGRRSQIFADHRADIDASDDPQAKLKEIEDRLNKLRSPFRSAEKFWVEEIIDPRKTRSLLCEFARLAEPLRTTGPVTNMKIRT